MAKRVPKTLPEDLHEEFPEFITDDGYCHCPRTADDKRWAPYTLTGDQVGALRRTLYLFRKQFQEIGELRAELESLHEAQQIIDGSISDLDPDGQ